MNKQRTYQMCRLAIFEKEHKEQLEGAKGYFRSDYIGRKMIGTALRITVVYLLILAGWGLFHFDQFTLQITEMDIEMLAGQILLGYLALLGLMMVITYVIWSGRYAEAEEDLAFYQTCLKSLEKSYEEEEEALRTRTNFKRG